MGDERQAEQAAFIASVCEKADSRYQLPADFVQQCLDFAPLEALNSLGAEQIVEVLHALHAHSQMLTGPRAEVVQPRPETGHRHAYLLCAAPDMAFLVDSLSMAVRKHSSAIDWILHPVMHVTRDGDGQRVAVHPRVKHGADDEASRGGEGNSKPESLIFMAFEPLESDKHYAELQADVNRVIHDLSAVVADFMPMRRRLQTIVAELAYPAPGCSKTQFAEAREFLRWLDDEHFTFLGFRETRLGETESGTERLKHVADSGLGLLRDERTKDRDAPFVAPPSEMQKYVRSSRLLVITKSAARSHLHHPEYMDSISIKHYDDRGEIVGTYRFLGLFSAEVYSSAARSIPIVRAKMKTVLDRTGLPPGSHAAKTLRDIIESLPRDELLQSSEDELYDTVIGIRALHDRTQLKLFMRRDRYGRFQSCMVYMPRDRYTPQMRERMASALAELFDATSVDRQVQFLRNGYARVHYMVRTAPGAKTDLSVADIEFKLAQATRTWSDALLDALRSSDALPPGASADQLAARYGSAFALGYTERESIDTAVQDIISIEAMLASDSSIPQPKLLIHETGDDAACSLRLYVRKQPVNLSDILPTLENFGLAISNHRPNRIALKDSEVWVQEFNCELAGGAEAAEARAAAAAENAGLFSEAFQAAIQGWAENDALNQLVLSAGLPWRSVALVRAITKYLLQTGIPYSAAYMADIVAHHAEVARLIVDLFELRFDPERAQDADARHDADLDQQIATALDAISTLDADRVLRNAVAVVRATLRTNYYQRVDGQPRPCIALKIRPSAVPELPKPLPFIETFVYGPDVEGIHLRGGMVSRGGLRWSDRREDFRTEVLGLMKAQMVKNAVIVPVGAKGGFVVKNGPAPGNRDAFLSAGVERYKQFIGSLLDITDNRVDDTIVPPEGVVRHDDDDPYLVVAADKGTATFSDIANEIAISRGFWLGDAFASGGAAGYDHKKMGITARSAWESVKRHFFEMGRDSQTEPFTVVGIGDMSGDVFGNGMLLSPQIKLVAAFNHLHIFIDPNPDVATSFAERKRLFEMGRSSWTDYDSSLISDGGGIYERSAKQITLSDAAREALGIQQAEALRPDALIQLILQAQVDLLWNGGIGTYVRASDEANADVGDRANDALRITARQLNAKVVGEGGNLGMTQRARIEYATGGGRINTDAIDNVGGVSSSDREVNIKIPLNLLMRSGELKEEDRNAALAAATDSVAELVLDDAREQGRAISIIQSRAVDRLDEHANLMRILERRELLDRAIEYLPSEDGIAERRAKKLGLTRPEIAVLLSYSKIALYQDLLSSDLPDEPALQDDLMAYFPPSLRDAFESAFNTHRLRRELVATLVTNEVVNTMGMAFIHRMAEEQGCTTDQVAHAYLAGSRVFGVPALLERIERESHTAEGALPAEIQYQMMTRVTGLAKHACTWFLPAARRGTPIHELVEIYQPQVDRISAGLPDQLPAAYREDWDRACKLWQEDGVPRELAAAIADTRVLGTALDIVWQANEAGQDIDVVADVFFKIGEHLHVLWLHGAINKLAVSGRWPALARVTLREDTYRLHSLITGQIVDSGDGSAESRIETWIDRHAEAVAFSRARIQEIRVAPTIDYMALTVAVRELRKLRLAE